ncbi:Neurexin-4 [Pseudolycoriella hygida]|uniref:Neurexin-4 n=1 Tax=Pseudolycoriella hygida TaxID=35572 RepID=A0A9Q0NBF2_9DIPT|nr:Neurexin-4 [Pseudolycoriella hygida]
MLIICALLVSTLCLTVTDAVSDYYESTYYSQYECNVPLLDRAVISATSSLRERGPENARLNAVDAFVFL